MENPLNTLIYKHWCNKSTFLISVYKNSKWTVKKSDLNVVSTPPPPPPKSFAKIFPY